MRDRLLPLLLLLLLGGCGQKGPLFLPAKPAPQPPAGAAAPAELPSGTEAAPSPDASTPVTRPAAQPE